MVQDDPKQSRAATALIEDHCTVTSPAFINLIVLCELTWVLSSSYSYSRDETAGALRQLLLTECFEFESHDLAWAALHDYQENRGGYADCLIGLLNHHYGAEQTYTFDRKAAKGRYCQLL
jgi:predicted nucleic-acid-binding protein